MTPTRALRSSDLVPGVQYETAMGELCVLLPRPVTGPGSDGTFLSFAYVRRGVVLKDNGFTLNPNNVGACLREPRL